MSDSAPKPSERRHRLQLKLQAGATGARCDAVMDVARRSGAVGVRPLFPGSPDTELSLLYTIEAESEKAARSIMDSLEGLADVEFVEEEVKRTLKTR